MRRSVGAASVVVDMAWQAAGLDPAEAAHARIDNTLTDNLEKIL